MTILQENNVTDDTIKMVIRSEDGKVVTKEKLCQAIDSAAVGTTIVLTGPRASDELTARLHCAIRCIAKQLTWAGQKLTEDDWKRLLTAAVFGQRVLPSPDGKGFVVLDCRTSQMSGSQKWNLLEYIYAWGSEHNVIFDEEVM
jgi:hypothetical protein